MRANSFGAAGSVATVSVGRPDGNASGSVACESSLCGSGSHIERECGQVSPKSMKCWPRCSKVQPRSVP